MAHIYSSLGSKVTIVEMLPDILMNMDSDITAVMRKIMKKNKVSILTGTKVGGIEEAGEALSVKVTDDRGRGKRDRSREGPHVRRTPSGH